jgi:hypothetical protein
MPKFSFARTTQADGRVLIDLTDEAVAWAPPPPIKTVVAEPEEVDVEAMDLSEGEGEEEVRSFDVAPGDEPMDWDAFGLDVVGPDDDQTTLRNILAEIEARKQEVLWRQLVVKSELAKVERAQAEKKAEEGMMEVFDYGGIVSGPVSEESDAEGDADAMDLDV